MEIKPVKTETDYEAALAEIEQLFEAEPGTEGDRLEVLTTQSGNYFVLELTKLSQSGIVLYSRKKNVSVRF